MEYGSILFDIRGHVAWITLNRPDRLNAFDQATMADLRHALRRVAQDRSVGVVVLTGAGDKAFCAGGDLNEMKDFDSDKARRVFGGTYEALKLMREIPQPIIAAVNGLAMGGGNELLVCSDLAIASEHARFGEPTPRVGAAAVFGPTNLGAIQMGEKRAREVIYLGRQYSAEEALRMGWVNKVVPHVDLLPETERWCAEILQRSPAAIELCKVSSNVWWDMLAPSMAQAYQTLLRLADGEEMHEGVNAFLGKRSPDYARFRRRAD